MKKNDEILIKPNVCIELFNSNMDLKSIVKKHNSVTSAGKYGIMDQILSSPTLSKAGWMEVGTSTGGVYNLASYVPGSRTPFSSCIRLNNIITMITYFTEGVGTGVLTEAGVFDIDTQDSPNMWLYVTFDSQTKLSSDILRITWTLTML